MNSYVCILRGINVGGKRKMRMADLRQCLENLGFYNVSTYIQSGNVVFDGAKPIQIAELQNKIQQEIQNVFGFDVPVVVRNANEFQSIISNNPFLHKGTTAPEHLHVTFLGQPPSTFQANKLEDMKFPPDEFRLIGQQVYLYCAGKSSDSKLTNQLFERTLQVDATTRNWKTISQLAKLCEER